VEYIGSSDMKQHLREVHEGRLDSSYVTAYRQKIRSSRGRFQLWQVGFGPHGAKFTQVIMQSVCSPADFSVCQILTAHEQDSASVTLSRLLVVITVRRNGNV